MYIVNTLTEKKESEPARGFGYTISGIHLIQVYGFFVTIRVLFFLDLRYSVYRHELNVYFSLELFYNFEVFWYLMEKKSGISQPPLASPNE